MNPPSPYSIPKRPEPKISPKLVPAIVFELELGWAVPKTLEIKGLNLTAPLNRLSSTCSWHIFGGENEFFDHRPFAWKTPHPTQRSPDAGWASGLRIQKPYFTNEFPRNEVVMCNPKRPNGTFLYFPNVPSTQTCPPTWYQVVPL